jgi:ribosomal protein S12 methylthiotransferase
VLALMADGLVLPYLDVPFQHAPPDVLKRMKRPASGERNIERVRAWRAAVPELTIRSTFIAGFPGETEAQFQYLLDFLAEAELDRVGCFAYSPVDGAAANALPGAVPEEVKQDRLARFMELQAEISADKLEAKVGSRQQVLVDLIDGELAIGRSRADAPDIDGTVQIQDGAEAGLQPGDFVDVHILGSDEHDLFGRVRLEDEDD